MLINERLLPKVFRVLQGVVELDAFFAGWNHSIKLEDLRLGLLHFTFLHRSEAAIFWRICLCTELSPILFPLIVVLFWLWLLFNFLLHDHRLIILEAEVQIDGCDFAANKLVGQSDFKELLCPAFAEPTIPRLHPAQARWHQRRQVACATLDNLLIVEPHGGLVAFLVAFKMHILHCDRDSLIIMHVVDFFASLLVLTTTN